jgi:hypothetical protein
MVIMAIMCVLVESSHARDRGARDQILGGLAAKCMRVSMVTFHHARPLTAAFQGPDSHGAFPVPKSPGS